MKLIFNIAIVAVLSGCMQIHALAESALEKSVIRVNSIIQKHNFGQPWDKQNPRSRQGLAVCVGEAKVLTTAEMVADAAFIEFETTDGMRKITAKVDSIDYKANLALLSPKKQEDKKLLASLLTKMDVACCSKIGNTVEVLQVKEKGTSLTTEGIVRSVDVSSSFVSGSYFLTYEVKASMQRAANSFTVPVFEKGKLLGLLTYYNSEDQMLDVLAPEIITAFLEDAKDGDYKGFPSIGLKTARTTDPHLRSYLKMEESVGGLYVTGVQRNSPAANAKIKKGDVVFAIDGHKIDRLGYFQSSKYGKLYWTHLINAEHKMGESAKLSVLRDGKKQEILVKLTPIPEGLIPSHMHDKAPKFLVKGGLIFQELTGGYLEIFGGNWQSRAPLNLLDVYNHPEDYETGRNRVVFLSAVIPTQATQGYERLRSIVILKVNDKPIADIASLVEAFKNPKNGIHKIELDSAPSVIYLSAKGADKIDSQLIQRGFPSLMRK